MARSLTAVALLLAVSVWLCAATGPAPFRQYPGWEYYDFPLPSDWNQPAEWAFARLMYPSVRFSDRPYTDWLNGQANWTMDYPRSDRHLSGAIRRLTRVSARSVEQPVNLDSDGDVFDWPWLYGVEVGHWDLTDAQAAKMREFLLRGGFFMCDDFHGTAEWEVFTDGMKKVFPDRPIVEIENADAIFHTVYDLDDRYQVPGEQFVKSRRTFEHNGTVPHWRGIYDDKGRVMVAMCFNMDLGDSWEHADNPEYPQQYSELGIRVGVDYVIYAMTH